MADHILLVEDEKSLADTLALNLQMSGYTVSIARSGDEALQLFHAQQDLISLVLLDVMLPGKSGTELLPDMRKVSPHLPVIFLTARSHSSDKINGLKLGADDYVTKPFDLEELLLRISNLLKRSLKPASSTLFSFPGGSIDFDTFEITDRQGLKQTLSRREIGLLEILTSSANKVVSRDEIISKLWDEDQNASTRTIDNYILNFRKLFEENPREPRHFHSVRGVGYKFTG